jgi:HlyD family secretion protein
MIPMKHRSRLTALSEIAILLVAVAGCSGTAEQIQDIVPALNGTSEQENQLQVSGFIEAQEVSVVAENGGRVAQVLVDQADAVTARQVVVILDDALLLADREQTQAAVTIAEANLADLMADPTQQELAAAQALIDRAQANLDGAHRVSAQAWAAVRNPRTVDVQISAAEVEIAQLDQQIEALEAQIREKQTELDQIKDDDPRDETRIDLLTFAIQQLDAQLGSVQALRAGAVRKLQLLRSQRSQPLAQIAEAHRADAQVRIAEAQLELAQAQYDIVAAPPLPEEIAIAQAQIAMARAQVALVDARIAQMQLAAPIDGVVTTRAISAGETATPGVPLLTIANLERLKLIVYVPETQIGQVQLGALADIAVDPYPGEYFVGEITRIGREAEFTPRNVQTEEERVNLVFAVEISIDNPDGRLKPGMPADAILVTNG